MSKQPHRDDKGEEARAEAEQLAFERDVEAGFEGSLESWRALREAKTRKDKERATTLPAPADEDGENIPF